MINNIFSKRKMKREKPNVNINDYSRIIIFICVRSGES